MGMPMSSMSAPPAGLAVEPLAMSPRSVTAHPAWGGGADLVLLLQFVNTDIAILARRLGAMLGRNVRVDARVKGAVQLRSEQAVTAQQAWRMFGEVLAQKNISVVAEPGGYFITLPSAAGTEPVLKPELAAWAPDQRAMAGRSNGSVAEQPEISVEWAPTPRPTLSNVSQAPRPEPVALAEPSAIWALQTKDKTLYHSLNRWAQAAQWQLMWEAERDFPIQAQISFEGGFTAAIEAVMSALAGSDYPLQAIMNRATRVVSVVRHQQLADR
jgi:hypothetical protein